MKKQKTKDGMCFQFSNSKWAVKQIEYIANFRCKTTVPQNKKKTFKPN